MFSPYGIGPLPPSAMVEIEKKAAGLQSSSLRRLLDMDKKHKVRGAHRPPCSPGSWSAACWLGCRFFVCWLSHSATCLTLLLRISADGATTKRPSVSSVVTAAG